MKNKDLNTYINDKLEEGNGLSYKEEYWNGMNKLLDANMATQATSAAHTATAVKATTGGLKLLYLSSICVAIFAVSYTYTHIFTPNTPTAPVTSENNVPAAVIEPLTPENLSAPSTEHVTSSEQQTLPNTTETATNPALVSPTPETDTHSEKTPAENTILNPDPATPNTTPSVTPETVNPARTAITHPGELYPAPSSPQPLLTVEENVSTRTIDFSVINTDGQTMTLNRITGINPEKVSLMPYPNRNRLIEHIALSPFASVIHEYDNQRYQAPKADYSHPVQTHMAYGINVECATKQFALRSGIGWSQTSMLTSVSNSRDLYKVDTTFVVINSNYDTTLSGKPVALVQRRIDSSYVSSEHSAFAETTTYQYVTIPLTLQYRIAYKRLTVVLEGGTLNHFLIAQQTNTPIQQGSSENRYPVQGYTLQLTAGSGLRYALSSNWALGIQYNYNLNPSSANLHFLNNAHVGTLMLTRTLR